MATTRLMPLHIGEGRSFSTAIEDIIDYSRKSRENRLWEADLRF